MNISSLAYTPTTTAQRPAAQQPPQTTSEDRFDRNALRVDVAGGVAAGLLGLVVAGGTRSFSPGLAYGMAGFIGASVGAHTDGNKLVGLAVGGAIGVGLAAAGIYGGMPGAFGAAAVLALARGVVLPTMLSH